MKFLEFERKMRQTLEESGETKNQIPKQQFDDVSKETVIRLTNSLSEIETYDDGIRAVENNPSLI